VILSALVGAGLAALSSSDAAINASVDPVSIGYGAFVAVVLGIVGTGGDKRRQAAAQFDVGISTVIAWVRRFRQTGSVAPGKMGGQKPKAIAGESISRPRRRWKPSR
jgi:hypothetical protein